MYEINGKFEVKLNHDISADTSRCMEKYKYEIYEIYGKFGAKLNHEISVGCSTPQFPTTPPPKKKKTTTENRDYLFSLAYSSLPMNQNRTANLKYA